MTERCGAYAEDAVEMGMPEGWAGCSLPKGHEGYHRDPDMRWTALHDPPSREAPAGPGEGDGETEAYETVNHPAHYGGDTTYEAIKVIDAWGFGEGFCLGNTIKYIVRAGRKPDVDSLEDLHKAQFYLDWWTAKLERGGHG